MRWCSWTSPAAGGQPRLGAVRERDGEDWLLDVGRWGDERDVLTPADLADLVGASETIQGRVAELVDAAPDSTEAWLHLADVRLLAPLRAPNALRDFLAFRDHVERGAARRGSEVPEAWERLPVYYKGNRRSISGPGDDIAWPSYTEQLDYECEVAAITGREGRDWSPDEAAAAIFGYTIMNDWSARDIQRDEMACWLGPAKAKDFNTTLGPYVVTPDEWDPEAEHAMTVMVDGEVWSTGTTKGRRWTFAELVAHVAKDEDVYPTDVFGSGTFGGGCGLDLDRWIKPDQVVTLAVHGLGVLSNRVVRY